jgi:arylsulfatase A
MSITTRRSFLHAAAATPIAARAMPPKLPNVVLIITDDQGYGDVGIHGNPRIHTPNMDRIAREGVQFTRFHVSPSVRPREAR